jgi:type IV pilus assembly protein PilX
VLIVSLVMLLVLTIIGVAGVQNTSMEERMAGNFKERYTAFQAAEAALRRGEADIDDISILSLMTFDGADGYTYTLEKFLGSMNPLDLDSYGKAVPVGTISGVLAPPEYFIEKLPKVPLPQSSLVVGFQSKPKDVQYYRVSARATGESGRAEVVLQSTYHR